MKLLISILLFSLFFTSPESSPEVPPGWLTDFSKAKQEAMLNKKMILINFSGSDWCGPCFQLKKKIFEADEFNEYASEHLVLVNADFPRLKKNELSKEQVKLNEALADKYNKEGKFPFTVLLDWSGKVIKEWEGCPDESPVEFIGEIKKIIHAGI